MQKEVLTATAINQLANVCNKNLQDKYISDFQERAATKITEAAEEGLMETSLDLSCFFNYRCDEGASFPFTRVPQLCIDWLILRGFKVSVCSRLNGLPADITVNWESTAKEQEK